MQIYLSAAFLIVAGATLWAVGRSRNKIGRSVSASSGSVAVGGDNTGVINNTNHAHSVHSTGGRKLEIIGIVVHLVGIVLALWEVYRHFFSRP